MNCDAFKIYLEAERLFTVVDDAKMAVTAKFALVTDMDPDYSRAWGWRSYTQVRSVLRGRLPESAMADAKIWADKAVELGPYDFATHWDLAFLPLNNNDYDGALAAYREGHKIV